MIYETNVCGCTIHPGSGVAHPGTCRIAGAHFKEWLKNQIIENTNHAHEYGIDKPEYINWKWPDKISE